MVLGEIHAAANTCLCALGAPLLLQANMVPRAVVHRHDASGMIALDAVGCSEWLAGPLPEK
jgi:hypothetical protein